MVNYRSLIILAVILYMPSHIKAMSSASQEEIAQQQKQTRSLICKPATTNTKFIKALQKVTKTYNITTINIAECNLLSDEAYRAIAAYCPELQILTPNPNLAAITSLDLSGCYKITDTTLRAILTNCHNLLSLNLRDCWQVSGAMIGLNDDTELQKNFLTRLRYSACELNNNLLAIKMLNKELHDILSATFTLQSIVELQNNPALQSKLDNITNLLDTAKHSFQNLWNAANTKDKKTIDTYCIALRAQVNILRTIAPSSRSVAALRDDALGNIYSYCPNLQKLNLAFCDQISDATLESIATKLYNLQDLDLSGCDQLTKQSLGITALFRNLKKLDISWCGNITGIDKFRQSHKEIDVTYVTNKVFTKRHRQNHI